jgi:hypothetical protein
MDTSGFYKLDTPLLYAPTEVHNLHYRLSRVDHHTYSYPVDGWYWFDSKENAHEFFNIPSETDNFIDNTSGESSVLNTTFELDYTPKNN